VFFGEAVAVWALRGRATQAVAEMCCGVVCLCLMGRAWRRGLILAIATAPSVAVFALYGWSSIGERPKDDGIVGGPLWTDASSEGIILESVRVRRRSS
jgi:hypothetical protein